MAKTLMVVCGTGIATSTIATGKIREYLESEGLSGEVKFLQSKISDEVSAIRNGDYDIVVSTTMVPSEIKDKVISGVALLTGVGAQSVLESVKQAVQA
ncbi:PTS sugar transporter subunit IIB [Weissella soli]|jgi:PTS system galactitol-specific IIB component|uniref:PTS sugar transporter subunit IIB n=1 Tax=Weissella soli TaxID=155866 RepID=UPI003C77C0E0